jgi:hypothetical protein
MDLTGSGQVFFKYGAPPLGFLEAGTTWTNYRKNYMQPSLLCHYDRFDEVAGTMGTITKFPHLQNVPYYIPGSA